MRAPPSAPVLLARSGGGPCVCTCRLCPPALLLWLLSSHARLVPPTRARCPACTVTSDAPTSSSEQGGGEGTNRGQGSGRLTGPPPPHVRPAALTTLLRQAWLRLRPRNPGARTARRSPHPPGCPGPKSHCHTPSRSPRVLRRHSLPSGLCCCPGDHTDLRPPLTGWGSPSPPRSRAPPASSPCVCHVLRKMKNRFFKERLMSDAAGAESETPEGPRGSRTAGWTKAARQVSLLVGLQRHSRSMARLALWS